MKILSNMSLNAFFMSLIILVFSGPANSALILDTASSSSNGFYTLGNLTTDQDPLGQSFVLGQSANKFMIGGMFVDVNPHLAPDLSITTSLVSGAGVGGTVLGSFTNILSDGFSGLHMVDFSRLGRLSAGTYTAVFSSGGTGRGGLQITGIDDTNSSAYNVDGLFLGVDPTNPARDFMVRVTAHSVGVPEPSSIALLAAGLLGLGFARRKVRS